MQCKEVPLPACCKTNFLLLPPANEVCEGYVFTRVCQSFCSGGDVMVSQHALQMISQHALQVVSVHALQVSGVRVYPSMPCRFPGPHPRGKLRGLAGRGVPRPTLGEGSPGPHLVGVCIPACTEADPHLTTTAVGGTHPTGMHSCFSHVFNLIYHSYCCTYSDKQYIIYSHC